MFTEEQINHLADNYADGKSSSSVFRDAHKKDFIAGFNKALSLFAVSGECEHPYHAVSRDKMTELAKCSKCGKEWY